MEIRGAYMLEEITKTNKMLNRMRERSRAMRKVLRRLHASVTLKKPHKWEDAQAKR